MKVISPTVQSHKKTMRFSEATEAKLRENNTSEAWKKRDQAIANGTKESFASLNNDPARAFYFLQPHPDG